MKNQCELQREEVKSANPPNPREIKFEQMLEKGVNSMLTVVKMSLVDGLKRPGCT